MKIENLQNFLCAERYVNNPKYSETAQYSEVEKKFHPRFGDPTFALPFAFVRKETVEIFESNPSRNVRDLVFGDDMVRFFSHPESVSEFKNIGMFNNFYRAVPTSSTRTVLLPDKENLMIKLHLNKKVSRFIRRLSRNSIEHSVLVSCELEIAANSSGCPNSFAFLPESLGVAAQNGCGFLVREFIPRPTAGKQRFLVPFFALYSKDTRNPDDDFLLSQLINRSKSDPLKYFTKFILEPFLGGWAYIFLNYGILLEAHGQNTLLEIDQNFLPTRIVHRDFQSLPIDPVIRKEKNLKNDFRKHIIGTEDYPLRIEQSLIFDHFIGDYLFNSFSAFFESEFNISSDVFAKTVQSVFRKYIPEEAERRFFPRGHIVFGKNFENNIVELKELHEKPTYRPRYN
jgi:hypothetical protein